MSKQPRRSSDEGLGASKPQQLEDNLAAAGLVLAAGEIAELDELTKPGAVYPNWFNEMVVDGEVKKAMGV